MIRYSAIDLVVLAFTIAEVPLDPQNVTVRPGAAVTYHNHGRLSHSASEMRAGMTHGGH